MKNLYSLLIKNTNSGFTLIELIAASIMTIFIVSAAGFGMIVMLREQTIATAGSDIQYNLNRAVDFISEEVKSANSIITNVSTSNLTAIAPDFTSSGKDVILVLNITGLTQPVIYYSQNSSDPWLGPKVIRRWGPEFTDSGDYSAPSVLAPSGWVGDVLVDSISDSSVAISCPSGWSSPNPASGNTTYGFYACVSPTNPIAIINLYASAVGDKKVENLVGITPNESTRFGDKATYSATTQVYARSKMNIPITVASGSATFSSTVPVEGKFAATSCASTFFPIDISGTTTNITTNGTITAILSGSPLSLTPAAGTFTVASTSSTNTVNFTSGSCLVTATLTTP
jgi:hypothetical protein